MNTAGRHQILEESEITSLFKERIPIKIEDGGLLICSSGQASVVIDMVPYTIKEKDLIVCFPYSMIQVIEISHDFNGNIISATPDFFNTLEVRNKGEVYVNIKTNPIIKLSENEESKLTYIYNCIIERKNETNHPFAAEIDECIVKIMSYEVAAIYMKRRPVAQQSETRKEMIFKNFVQSLFNGEAKNSRELETYASKQSISPRHLSTVVKEVSGLTATEWIARSTINNIKVRLYDNESSILDISEEFGFPNPSFFSQYFKKHTGISPREFRKSINQA